VYQVKSPSLEGLFT